MRELERLEIQLQRLGGLLGEEPDATPLRAAGVSAWSVAAQVDHMLKVLEGSFSRIEGEPKASSGGVNFAGRIVLASGWFPRGVGKSPEGARGEERPRAELLQRLAAVRDRLHSLAARDELWRERRPWLRHPYFGGLTPRQGVRFLVIHTRHHLRIVADIRHAVRGQQ